MGTKPKLVYIIHGVSVGGAELALLSALPALSTDFDLRVFVLGKSDRDLVEKIDAKIRGKMSFWNFPASMLPFYLPFVYWSLVQLAPDIIISSLWRATLPAIFYRWSSKRTKYIIMLHSSVFFHKFDRFFTLSGMREADAIFTDSIATKRFAEQFVANGKDVRVLSYLTKSTPIDVTRRCFDGKFSFFFLGGLSSVKRVPLAIRVIAWLRDKGLDASLHIYGKPGNDESVIKDVIGELDLGESVVICGEVPPDERTDLYGRHNGYIQLSAYEGMAMSVAEALQQGMLCVVTPVGEIPNYAVDGVNAIFMDVTGDVVSERSLRNLLAVLEDTERCKAISSAAHRRFKNVELFADSLVDAIQKT